MKNLSTFVSALAFVALFPTVAFALAGCPVSTVGGFICKIQEILNSIIPVLIALGVLYLVWGIVRYVIGDSEEAKKKGRDRIIFGLIGLAVIIGIWGLVFIITNTFGIEEAAPTSGYFQGLLPQ